MNPKLTQIHALIEEYRAFSADFSRKMDAIAQRAEKERDASSNRCAATIKTLSQAKEAFEDAKSRYEELDLAAAYDRLVVLPELSRKAFEAKNPIPEPEKGDEPSDVLSIMAALTERIALVTKELDALLGQGLPLTEKAIFPHAKALFAADKKVRAIFPLFAPAYDREEKAAMALKAEEIATIDAKKREEDAREQKDKDEKATDNLRKLTALVEQYNAEKESVVLSNARAMPRDFDAAYSLPVLANPEPDAKKVSQELQDRDASLPALYDFQTYALDLTDEAKSRMLLFGSDGEALMRAYRRIVFEFILSYPSKYKNIVAVHHKAGSEFYEFLSKVGALGKNEFLFVADKKTVFTSSDEIQTVLREINDKINAVSEKLGIGGYSNVYDYNHDNQDNPEPLVLLLFHACPDGIDNQQLKDALINIFEAGPRCGVIPVVNIDESLVPEGYSHVYMQELVAVLKKAKNALRFDIDEVEPLPIRKDFDEPAFLSAISKDLAKADRPILMKDIVLEEDFATSPRRKEFSKKLVIPVGKANGKIQEVVLDASGKTHVIIEGGTGSGKTNFARAMIMSACYLYSPEELEIELFDFKDGLGFKQFADAKLKHVKFISFNNKIDDARDVIKYINSMLSERNRIIGSYPGTDTLAGYNKLAVAEGKKPIPRMIVVLDEYQEIMDLDDCLSALEDIARKGRAAGISLIFSSQDVPKMSAFDRIKQLLDHRFVFQASAQNIAALIPAMEKRAEELTVIKGTAAYDLNINRPIIFRSAYAGNDTEIPEEIARINAKYPQIEAQIEQIGEALPVYVDDVSALSFPSKAQAKKDYLDEGAIVLPVGEYSISQEKAYLRQDEKNPVLFVMGEYVRSKDVLTSILLGDMKAMKDAGIATPSSNIRVLDLCDSSRKIRRENPLSKLIAKKAELEEAGDYSLSYFDYFEKEQFGDVLGALKSVVAEREKDSDLRDPLIVMLLAVDDFSASAMETDALTSIIAKGKKLDIYFVIQMDSPNCDFFRNSFRSSRSNNAQLIKDAIILSDGEVAFSAKDKAEKTFAPSLTAKSAIESLSGVISNNIVNSYLKALDANPLDPSFAFLVDDGILFKVKYHAFRGDFAETLKKEFA